MALNHLFGPLGTPPDPPIPTQYLDDNFNALNRSVVLACTAANANAIVLTPISNQPDIFAYSSLQQFAFLAAASSSSAVTISVVAAGGPLAALKVYKDGAGTVQANSGDILANQFYAVAYVPWFDSGAGGFLIVYPSTVSISTAGFVQKTGDTMTGALTLPGNPTTALQAATKQYVDLHLPLAGGTMTGNVQLKTETVAVSALGTVSGTTNLNLGAFNVFTMTIGGTTTLALTNVPSSIFVPIVLQITNGGSATVNWPSGSKFPGGTPFTLTTSGVDVVVGYTIDSGTTVRWQMAQRDSS
jgi:hypothetical protein